MALTKTFSGFRCYVDFFVDVKYTNCLNFRSLFYATLPKIWDIYEIANFPLAFL